MRKIVVRTLASIAALLFATVLFAPSVMAQAGNGVLSLVQEIKAIVEDIQATVSGLEGRKGEVTLLNQDAAATGGVTPNDSPGFPISITEPGSFRLSGNLTVPDADTTAIEISADDVTIDLNGFAIIGPTVCPTAGGPPSSDEGPVTTCSPLGSGVGIKAAEPYTIASNGPVQNYRAGTRVLNGTIRGMGGNGAVLGLGAHVEGVTFRSNGGSGLLTGRSSIVRNNTAVGNGAKGLFVGNGSYTTGNTSGLNNGVGLQVGSGVITENVAHKNGSFGLVQFGDSGPRVFVSNTSEP